jgi:Flp pilus assembly protein TadD
MAETLPNFCRHAIKFTATLALGLLPACGLTLQPDLQRSDAVGRQLSADIAEVMATNRVYETAVPLLQQGIMEDPNNARLHRLLGIVLRDRGVYDQAMTELQVAHSLAPADGDTAAAVGVLYDLQQRHDAAEAWHRHALDINPNRSEFYNNLGFSMYLHGSDYAAVGAFRESLRRNPNQPRVYNNLGFALARLGEREQALRSFAQGGTRAAAMANLGLAYELKGETAEARDCYKQALKIDHRLEVARRNLHNLDQTPNLAQTESQRLEVQP